MTTAVTRNRIALLQGQFTTVVDLDAELYSLADANKRDNHAYFKEDQFSACEDLYHESLDFMHDKIAENESSVLSSTQNENVSTVASSRPISHLPRLGLPTFDGSFAQWETFRDRFTSMIIDDQNLSNVERLHYLCSVLSGEASQAVAHLPVTDANFDVAWKLISTRYENKRRLINTHLQALFSLPQIASENSRNLQTLHDQTNTSIQALKNLGRLVDSWDDILVYLVAQKLDKTSRKAWELKLSDTVEPPAYSDISKFLDPAYELSMLCFRRNREDQSTLI